MNIYLHMVGSLFFYFCLTTYEKSSTRLDIIDELGLRKLDTISEEYVYTFDYIEPLAEKAQAEVSSKGPNAQIFAWVPAYDNFDGSEKFWRHYELSLMDDD